MNMKDNSIIKVSIIVPIYNVEQYLKTCVDSLIHQTYKNIEIILVDDGSTDNCPQICDEYKENDNRVQIIHKTNGGLSSARNAGINGIAGDYAMFVDGDDWIDSDTVEYLVRSVTSSVNNVDCLLFSYVKERNGKSESRHIFDTDRVFSPKEGNDLIYRRLFGPLKEDMRHPEKLDYLSSCCMKLYKTTFIRQGEPFSNEYVGTGEDGLFNIYALYKAEHYSYIDKPFYHYRYNPSSITSVYKKGFDLLWDNLFYEYSVFIKYYDLGLEYTQALDNRIALSVVGIGINELLSNHSTYRKIRNIKKYIVNKSFRNSLKKAETRYLPFAWRTLLICAKLRLAVIVFIMLSLGNKRREHQ